ncbi:MAG: UxaA family hydrolase [Pseudomonadota bacterium]
MATSHPIFLRLHHSDNVVVALEELAEGISIENITARQTIRRGHKVCTHPIRKGDIVRKYGQVIGWAACDIEPGEHVHVHNVELQKLSMEYEYATEQPAIPALPDWAKNRSFLGYPRDDGRVGTRNFILIASTVNCSATVVRGIASAIKPLLADYPNIDGVLGITHKTGCGIVYGTPQHDQFARVIAGYAKHPNVSRCLMIGLGCEVGGIPYLSGNKDFVPETALRKGAPGEHVKRGRVEAFTMQDVGGTRKAIELGVSIIKEWLPEVNALKRVSTPISKLVLGTNCGGSDGYSGLTANPAVGEVVDILTAAGATGILAETPETFGAHHIFARRAVTPEVGKRLIEKIQWWEEYTAKFGASCDGNPSSGNKEGGLTTILEKSLGAAMKGGSTALNAVYDYGQQVDQHKGFVFMDTPGLDPTSVTGLLAGGANMIVFTTGRGSCFGSKPAPTVKVATNSTMYQRMIDDMDINAGCIIEGTPRSEVARELFEQIIAVASGAKSKSEAFGYGDEEFAPWDIGPTM